MMINREMVKRYFEGKNQLWAKLLMFGGLLLMGLGIGVLMLIGGFVWYLYNKFSADLSGEAEVDRARANEIKLAKERALKKLNLVEEQVLEVDPVLVSGRGYEPETSKARKMSTLKKLIDLFKKKVLKKMDSIEADPVYLARIGSDSKYRSSLISVSVFMFGETQLYIYYCNVDLCTGLVYSEGTHEYFYSDINGMSFEQEKEKIYNFKTRKYQRILFEYVKIYASGCSHSAALATDVDSSVIEKEFAGMRTLIRERKNAN